SRSDVAITDPALTPEIRTAGGRAASEAEDAPEMITEATDVEEADDLLHTSSVSAVAGSQHGDDAISSVRLLQRDLRSIRLEQVAGQTDQFSLRQNSGDLLQDVFRSRIDLMRTTASRAGMLSPGGVVAPQSSAAFGGSPAAAFAGLSGLSSPLQTSMTSSPADLRQPLSSQAVVAIHHLLATTTERPTTRLTIRLDPPEMGAMSIRIDRHENGLRVRITASEPVTLDMLLNRGQDIEHQLKTRDVNLETLEFAFQDFASGDGQQSHADRSAMESLLLNQQSQSNTRSRLRNAASQVQSSEVRPSVIQPGHSMMNLRGFRFRA
ncbi:MAG: flagellar hook-length control protein FliK, partial [Planctomycetaceae bacterium]|nr:flagellar hook-length control protein FliK [Planctomycetaceae bacterium]